jgi:hypothetical protein
MSDRAEQLSAVIGAATAGSGSAAAGGAGETAASGAGASRRSKG